MDKCKSKKENGKRKVTAGKLVAVVIGLIVAVYLLFSVSTFYSFVKLMFSEKNADSKNIQTESMMELE